MSPSSIKPPNSIPWPPLIYLIVILAAIGLKRFWPLGLGGFGLVRLVGCCLAALALAFDFWAMLTMFRHGTNILPHRAANHLVVDGPFAISRNPIYVGNTGVLIGLALGLDNVWLLILAPIAAKFVEILAIQREEAHLQALFGTVWTNYSARVPRWLWP